MKRSLPLSNAYYILTTLLVLAATPFIWFIGFFVFAMSIPGQPSTLVDMWGVLLFSGLCLILPFASFAGSIALLGNKKNRLGIFVSLIPAIVLVACLIIISFLDSPYWYYY